MYKIISGSRILEPYQYKMEKEFEQEIIKNKNAVFGEESIYFDIKKKLGNTIPDAYWLDLTYQTDPTLYLVENETGRAVIWNK